MSFLVSDNDYSTTLGGVIDFIDTLEFDATGALFGPDCCEFVARATEISPNPTTTNECSMLKSKRRKRRTLSSSTRLQQSKRAEVLYLRKRILELEDQLQHLQTTLKRPCCVFPRDESNADGYIMEVKSTWKEVAEAHYHTRLLSEEKNRTLKALVVTQIQASKRFLQKQPAFPELNIHPAQDISTPNDNVNVFLGPVMPYLPIISSFDCKINEVITPHFL